MPELSRPLIAILGVVISIAVLFIAVAGFLPFFQQSVSSTTQTASFSMTANAATFKSDGNITKIIFTIQVQKLVGSGEYTISADSTGIVVYEPNGTDVENDANANIGYPSSDITFTSTTNTQAFTVTVTAVNPTHIPLSTGNWVIIITVTDSNGNVAQQLQTTVGVA